MANELVKQEGMTREQIDLIKSTVAVGATDLELKLFLYTAAKRGLDPLLKQIYFIKRKRKTPQGDWEEVGTIQTGIDGFRLISDRTKKLSGIKRGVIRENGKLIGAWAEVYRNDWNEPARVEVSFNEYKQVNKEGELQGLWRTMPENQLQKCAEAAAHRMAFPEDLSGIYSDDEMGQADRPESEIKQPAPEIRKTMVEAVNKASQPATKGTETSHTPQGTALPASDDKSPTPQDGTLPAARIYKPEVEHKPCKSYGDLLNSCWTELKLSKAATLKAAKKKDGTPFTEGELLELIAPDFETVYQAIKAAQK